MKPKRNFYIYIDTKSTFPLVYFGNFWVWDLQTECSILLLVVFRNHFDLSHKRKGTTHSTLDVFDTHISLFTIRKSTSPDPAGRIDSVLTEKTLSGKLPSRATDPRQNDKV